MNIQNHETYDKIKFAEGLKVVAMNDGGEELPQKVEEEKKICWEEVKRLRVAMVVVMKQLNVAMLHVGSFIVTDGDGRGGGGQDEEMMQQYMLCCTILCLSNGIVQCNVYCSSSQ